MRIPSSSNLRFLLDGDDVEDDVEDDQTAQSLELENGDQNLTLCLTSVDVKIHSRILLLRIFQCFHVSKTYKIPFLSQLSTT